MERQEIGRFYATTFNGITFEFIVFNNNTIDCPALNLRSFSRIDLKPRFVLSKKGSYYTYITPTEGKDKNQQELIGNYDIDNNLFDYLKQHRMIIYSNDMAYLYGFNDKNGYDSDPNHYGVGSPYKWAKKKGPILVKQKKFIFNKLFAINKKEKQEVVTAFSGLLEMSRRNKVETSQEELFGDIVVEQKKSEEVS